MKDTQKNYLKAFLFSLSQQKTRIPDEAIISMQEIAQSLESRVSELNLLAQSIPSLSEPYEEALTLLLDWAAERGMGLDFLPATDDGGASDRETPNLTRDVRSDIEKMKQILAEIEAKLDRAPSILAAANPVQAARSTFHS